MFGCDAKPSNMLFFLGEAVLYVCQSDSWK